MLAPPLLAAADAEPLQITHHQRIPSRQRGGIGAERPQQPRQLVGGRGTLAGELHELFGTDAEVVRRARDLIGPALLQLRTQAGWCRDIGSPIYAALLFAAADDCEAGGPTWGVVDGHEDMPIGDVLPIRIAGSVHRLVLTGRAPELARYYASAGGTERGDAWPAFRAVLEEHRDERWRRTEELRIERADEVERWIDEVGFAWTLADVRTPGPSLYVAVCGRRDAVLRWRRGRF